MSDVEIAIQKKMCARKKNLLAEKKNEKKKKIWGGQNFMTLFIPGGPCPGEKNKLNLTYIGKVDPPRAPDLTIPDLLN